MTPIAKMVSSAVQKNTAMARKQAMPDADTTPKQELAKYQEYEAEMRRQGRKPVPMQQWRIQNREIAD